MSAATITEQPVKTAGKSDPLTETLKEKLHHPATSPDFDLHEGVNEVLADIGMTTADSGGELTFYGSDPILPSPIRFGTMAAIGLAARGVALAALWKEATGEGQDISVDVRKALRRFAGFFEGKWELSMADRLHQEATRLAHSLRRGMCSFGRHATDDTWWHWTFILNSLCAPSIFSAAVQVPNPLTTPF